MLAYLPDAVIEAVVARTDLARRCVAAVRVFAVAEVQDSVEAREAIAMVVVGLSEDLD